MKETPPEPLKRLWTVRDLATRLGETESAVRNRIKRNQIPADCILDMGARKLRFDPKAVEFWIESCRRRPAS